MGLVSGRMGGRRLSGVAERPQRAEEADSARANKNKKKPKDNKVQGHNGEGGTRAVSVGLFLDRPVNPTG